MNHSSRNLFFRVLAVACIFSILAGCGSLPEQETKETEPITVEFTNWWGDYTLIVAYQQGLFDKYGVKVTPVYYDTFSRALPDLAVGKIDGGLLAIGDAINISRHTNIKVVAVYDNGSFNTIVSIPEITQIAELENRRIGVPIGSSYELLISEMLKSEDLSMSDVTLVNVAPENVPASLGKTIDAGFVYEPYTSEAVTQGNNLLLKSTDLIGLYPDVIAFRSEIVKNRPDDIRKFLQAWFEAVDLRQKDPNGTRKIIADYFQTSINEISPDTNLEILTLEENYQIFDSNSRTRQSIQQTARLNADFLVQMGVLSKNPDLQSLLDSTFLP